MMKVGIDTFTISILGLDPFQTLDYISAHDLDGAQFGHIRGLSPDLDTGYLKEIRQYADSLDLYSYVSISSPNPFGRIDRDRNGLINDMKAEIESAAEIGWHELHSAIGSPTERYSHAIPWKEHVSESVSIIQSISDVLQGCGSRINLETHGDITTFELVEIAETAGADVCGICLDTANVLLFGEDPVSAARRAAPYTHITHAKDAILYFGDKGLVRQGRPPGDGILVWNEILAALAEYSPDLPLSIEDHKWIFKCPIFDRTWYQSVPQLKCEEMGMLVKAAWETQRKILSGSIADPDEYESIPFADQLEDRLACGRDHLRGAIESIGI